MAKRDKPEATLFQMPRHYVHGIMEKKRSNFVGASVMKRGRVRVVALNYRERFPSDMMRRSDKNGVDCLALDRFQFGSAFHPAS